MDAVTWCILMRNRAYLGTDMQAYRAYDKLLGIWKERSGAELGVSKYLYEEA